MAAARALLPRITSTSRSLIAPSPFLSRSFQTSSRRLQEAIPVATVPVKKPVGAFRGGLFGFLLGSTLAGASVYYYILEEYKALQAAVQRIHSYVTELDNRQSQQEARK